MSSMVWRYLPISRRVALIYLLFIIGVFLVHFKIADDFTFAHSQKYSTNRCRFGCFRSSKFYKLFSTNQHPGFYSRFPKNNGDQNEKDKTVYFSQDTPQDKNTTSTSSSLYMAPKQEARYKRFPQCVIIGFTKCGTRALIEFLSLHPYIKVARNEVHFYDKDEHFKLGYEWYKDQMPYSYSNQITIEKTPAYILSERARDGMHKITPDVKLILLVRDPVVRLVSQFLLRFRLDNTADLRPVSDIYTNFTTGEFDPNLRPVDIGNYQKHIYMWLRHFALRQMLIINSEDLTQKPLSVIQNIEKFLKIPQLFDEWNVYYNKTSGFFCPRGFETGSEPRCLGKSKGLAHPKLSESESEMLYSYYKPFNEKLFHLIGYKINWAEREWGKEQNAQSSDDYSS